jgi:biopolymer transport protein ExbD
MKISGQKNYLVSLESVAMTDIVLNMFIFFFISFSLLYTFNPYRIQQLEVKLPEVKKASPLDKVEQVNITITNEGLLYLDKELVTKKALKGRIYKIYKNNPGLSVMVSSDRLVRFKDIVGVLDTLREVGVKNLNIAAVAEE